MELITFYGKPDSGQIYNLSRFLKKLVLIILILAGLIDMELV